MKTYVTSADDFAHFAYQRLSAKITELQTQSQKDIAIIFASGNTMFDILEKLSQDEKINWRRIQFYHLDEYHGLAPENIYSYAYYFHQHLLDKVPIPKANIHIINGLLPDFIEYQKLQKHPADICVLGVGLDGHLGFNEPGSSPRSRMRIVELKKSTILANQKKYPQIQNNPYAITLGLSEILQSKNIFLFANTKHKNQVFERFFSERIERRFPVSWLLRHPSVEVVLDQDAAKSINKPKVKNIYTVPDTNMLKDFFAESKKYYFDPNYFQSGTKNAFPVFQEQKIFILEENERQADLFGGNFIQYLENSATNIIKRANINLESTRSHLLKFQPDILFLPDNQIGSDWINQHTHLVRNKKALFYKTKDPEFKQNIWATFNPKTFNIMLAAIRAHKSQIKRNRYDQIAKLSREIAAKYFGQEYQTREDYAHQYYYFQIDKRGHVQDFPESQTFFINLSDRKKPMHFKNYEIASDTPVLIISPHPDDMEIAVGDLVRQILENHNPVYNYIFSSGSRGVKRTIYEKIMQKSARSIRMQEAQRASDILARDTDNKIVLDFLNLESYEHESEIKKRSLQPLYMKKDFEKILKKFSQVIEKNISINKGNYLMIMPSLEDTHPYHRIAVYLAQKAIVQLAKKYQQQIDILTYSSPWLEKYNTFFFSKENLKSKNRTDTQIAQKYKRMLSMIATEELRDFGSTNSLLKSDFKYTEGFYREIIK